MAKVRYRIGQNVCSPLCPIDHIDIARLDDIKEPSNSWPDIRGLHSLNYTRNGWLTGDAIEVSINTYISGLPPALQDKIWVGIPGVDPRVWHMGAQGQDALLRALKTPARRAVKFLRMTEYSILPICTDSNHWVLAVVRKNQRLDASGKNKEWSHVAQVAVFDSYRSAPRIHMVQDRLRAWLERVGGFTFAADYTKAVWVPLQRDMNSCGPRTYWAAKQMLDRLLILHERHVEYDAKMWTCLSGWFSEDFVRAEMMGRCAWAGVRAMDYKARISIECVNAVRDARAPNRPLIDAGAAMKPVENRSAVPEERPQPPPPHVQPNARTAVRGPEGSSDEQATVPQTLPKPPLPVPNQHQIAPGVRPAKPDMAAQGDKDRSPTFAQSPKTPRPAKRSVRASGSSSANPITVDSPPRSRATTTPAPKPMNKTDSSPRSRATATPAPNPVTNTSSTPRSRANSKPAPSPITNTSSTPRSPATKTPAPNPITITNTGSSSHSRANTTPAPNPKTNTGSPPTPPGNTKAALGSLAIASKISYSPTITTAYVESVIGPKGALLDHDLLWGPQKYNTHSSKRSHVSSDDAPRLGKRSKWERL
ncbi:hypothetical protein F5B17DRAFT_219623 [Nemania serpens]|nr:hypothetical protein F5B17DRAFT_219623 [Nemania serpens]